MTALADGGLTDIIASDLPFALLHRPAVQGDTIEVLQGDIATLHRLDELSVLTDPADVLALVPYRQIRERGLACNDDAMPLLALMVRQRYNVQTGQLIDQLPGSPIDWCDFRFDVSDSEYQRIVRAVISDEIGAGAGSNFVISRAFTGSIGTNPLAAALSLLRRLLTTEKAAYWTFLVHTGTHTFVGATPEAHVILDAGQVIMNPISGTYHYPAREPYISELLKFLNDQKEIDELFMVVDEELKMMSRVCPNGAVVSGPRLKEMAHLAHTEYILRGQSRMGPADLLRETMFAPTVMGSPLINASRVITRYERGGRGYYSGVIALIDKDPTGQARMDSAILIRTAVVDAAGRASIGVGSTLVRCSDPERETDETFAKAAALVGGASITSHPPAPETSAAIVAALAERNDVASKFWFAQRSPSRPSWPVHAGHRTLLIDAEDDFTAMLATILESLGLFVSIADSWSGFTPDDHDLVIFGPGPGDPTARHDSRIEALRHGMQTMLERAEPFVAVCLSHQILCAMLGMPIERLERPNQGVGRDVMVFGKRVRVGFYNTFVARSGVDSVNSHLAGHVEVSRNPYSREVYALRGNRFDSLQFHPESVLSRDGREILAATVHRLLANRTSHAAAG